MPWVAGPAAVKGAWRLSRSRSILLMMLIAGRSTRCSKTRGTRTRATATPPAYKERGTAKGAPQPHPRQPERGGRIHARLARMPPRHFARALAVGEHQRPVGEEVDQAGNTPAPAG